MIDHLPVIAAAARGCTVCADRLPLGPRPVFQVSSTARLLLIGQAPGTAVHASGTPWDDASGGRLRDWLGLTPAQFYDASRIALLPMGLCYPGRREGGGDLGPIKECAPTWHPALIGGMPDLRLTLLIGSYAIASRLGPGALSETVRGFRRYLPGLLPLPHPSWRVVGWQNRNPWFADEVLPMLRAAVRAALEPTETRMAP